MEMKSAVPRPEDYQEPKGAFLLLTKRLAFEGYSFSSVMRGMYEAHLQVTRKPTTDDWRSLFEAMGDLYAFNDDRYTDEESW